MFAIVTKCTSNVLNHVYSMAIKFTLNSQFTQDKLTKQIQTTKSSNPVGDAFEMGDFLK